MRYLFLIIFFSVLIVSDVCSQYRSDFDTTFGNVKFSSIYDTANYETKLTIKNKGNTVYEETLADHVYEIMNEAFSPGGKKYFLIHLFSGGAHCCSSLLIAEMQGNKYVVLDTGFYGNSGFVLEDLNKDGTKEIVSGNDMFAYAFTNYAETRFPLRVQKFENGKLIEITGVFKDDLLYELGYFEEDLNELIKEGFECPEKDDEDTFNTDAGSVKTILAAIVADYHSLGQVERGYELVEKVYKCVDKDKYIKTLKEDFKLK